MKLDIPSQLANMLAGLLIVRVVMYCVLFVTTALMDPAVVDVAGVESCDSSPLWVDWRSVSGQNNKEDSELTWPQ